MKLIASISEKLTKIAFTHKLLLILSDSDTKNGGIRDLSGSKETRECKAI